MSGNPILDQTGTRSVTESKTLAGPVPGNPIQEAAPERLVGLDAYRGFVILMMIFVNYIGEGVAGVPHWLKHAAVTEDLFTFPDLVFPGFLLMVGLAIPLAMAGKLDQPWGPTLRRILLRTVGLLAVGVLYENSSRYDAHAALLPKPLFSTLFYLAVIAVWYRGRKPAWVAWTGAGVLVALMFLFRGEVVDGYQGPYLEHTFWGILGLIGWGYGLCSVLYLVSRGSGTALMGAMAFMLVLFMADAAGLLKSLPKMVNGFVGIGPVLGSTAANVMAGVIAGRWFLSGRKSILAAADAASLHRQRILFTALFAAGMVAAGYMLRPYHPISKIIATESYTLITAGINLTGFLVFYMILDVLKWRGWAAWFIAAGTNALLAYILPDFWDNLLALVGLGKIWWAVGWPFLARGGLAAILNGAVISLLMLALTRVLTRLGLKLRF